MASTRLTRIVQPPPRPPTRDRRVLLACRVADLAASNAALASAVPSEAPFFTRGGLVNAADADGTARRFVATIVQLTRADAVAIRDTWMGGAAGRRWTLLAADGRTPRSTPDGPEATLDAALTAAGLKLARPASAFP